MVKKVIAEAATEKAIPEAVTGKTIAGAAMIKAKTESKSMM